MVRLDVRTVIRDRVRTLYNSQPGLQQQEFGDAIGRGYSWVSAFFAGKRHADDIDLLLRMARFFGVTVADLIGETGRTRHPIVAQIIAACDGLSDEHLLTVLSVAKSLPRRPTPAGANGESSAERGNTPRKTKR